MTIPEPIRGELFAHARREAPNECCGLLAGVGSLVSLRIGLENELASPIAYRASPRSLFEAFREIRAKRLDLVGFYHSHPTGEALPSRRDLEEWHYPDSIMVIIHLKNHEIRAWRKHNHGMIAVDLEQPVAP